MTSVLIVGGGGLNGLAASLFRPRAARVIGPAVQGFALLGTLVGLITIAIGVGPQTAPDLAFHAGIVVVLVAGLIAAFSKPSESGSQL